MGRGSKEREKEKEEDNRYVGVNTRGGRAAERGQRR